MQVTTYWQVQVASASNITVSVHCIMQVHSVLHVVSSVVCAGDKTLRLWALADGSCLKTFEGHTASVLRLNFLSAGTQVSLSSEDKELAVYITCQTQVSFS